MKVLFRLPLSVIASRLSADPLRQRASAARAIQSINTADRVAGLPRRLPSPPAPARLLAMTVIGLFVISSPCFAGPLEDGKAAFDRKDYQTALQLWQSLADKGEADAQYDIGLMYRWGYGVKQDYAEALKWYRKAAEQKYANAQYDIGYMYFSGYPVPKDYGEAMKWFRRAADQGYAQAQINLSGMYAEGLGVSRDCAESLKWSRKAAKQGYAQAQANIGLVYDAGCPGVARDYAQAAAWYRKAADQGLMSAQGNLGSMYEGGHGVPQDNIQAYMWYSLVAAQKGGEPFIKYCDALAAKMTPEEIAKAKQLVAEKENK